MEARVPFRFSLASLMMSIAVYAVLFGALRFLGASTSAFVMLSLYFTTVVYGQWALFAGRNPHGAAFLVSSVLFLLGFAANLLVSLLRSQCEGTLLVELVIGGICGGLIGLGIAGIVDIGLLLVEVVGSTMRKRSVRGASLRASSSAQRRGGDSYRGLPFAILCFIVCLFFLGALWGSLAGKHWVFQMNCLGGRCGN